MAWGGGEVRADTDDLAHFVTAGGGYAADLEGLLGELGWSRTRVLAALGDGPVSVSRRPFETLIADAVVANRFVDAVGRSLGAGGSSGGEAAAAWMALMDSLRAQPPGPGLDEIRRQVIAGWVAAAGLDGEGLERAFVGGARWGR